MDKGQTQEHCLHSPDDFKIKGAATIVRDVQRPHATFLDACTICLEPITERAIAVPCNHLTFDFLCLVSWLQERSRCPLCNAEVTRVEYDWRSVHDFKTYHVRSSRGGEFPPQDSSRRRGVPSSSRRSERQSWRTSVPSPEDPAIDRRRQVYQQRLFSLYVGTNGASGYSDVTHQIFANSANLQSRARVFLRRELQVFGFLDTPSAPRGGNKEFLIEYIVAILKINDIKGADGTAELLLSEYLGLENARLLLHELEAWLRSPFSRLSDWDAHVQYGGRSSRKTTGTG